MKNILTLLIFILAQIAGAVSYLPYAEPYMDMDGKWIFPLVQQGNDNTIISFFCGAYGTANSTAMSCTDSKFVEWASGWKDVNYGTNCAQEWRTPFLACGKATSSVFDIVCLGDGGSITMTFDNSICNGDGFDFAVFENSFNDTFLELAYVEVSSDGINFVRFPSTCFPLPGYENFEYGQTPPIGASGSALFSAGLVYNLASKYQVGYGHPFDLAELAYAYNFAKRADSTFSAEYKAHILANYPKLDLQNIRYVRIIDIIGDGRNRDCEGYPIIDPVGCVGSAGFDLNGIGVINSARASNLKSQEIIFEELGGIQFANIAPIKLKATASSGLPIAFSVISGAATIEGDILTPQAVEGTVIVCAYQAGNSEYASVRTYQSLTVTSKIFQTLTFSKISDINVANLVPITLTATSSSGLTPTYELITGDGVISDNILTLKNTTDSQMIIVRAKQAGNSTYATATPVEQTFAVYRNYAYSTWSAQNNVTDPNLDPNSDGYNGYFDYAMGMNPNADTSSIAPHFTFDNNTLTIRWRVRVDSTDIKSFNLKICVGTSTSWVNRPVTVKSYSMDNGFVYRNYEWTYKVTSQIKTRFDVVMNSSATTTSSEQTFVKKVSFADWLAENSLPSNTNPQNKTEIGDGFTYLQKYASNLNAKTYSSRNIVENFSLESGNATYKYGISIYAKDVTIQIQSSTNLVDWQDVKSNEITTTTDGTTIWYQIQKPITDFSAFRTKLNFL